MSVYCRSVLLRFFIVKIPLWPQSLVVLAMFVYCHHPIEEISFKHVLDIDTWHQSWKTLNSKKNDIVVWICWAFYLFALFCFIISPRATLMMSSLTREVMTGGMIFSYVFYLQFSSNKLIHSYKRGVHYKSLHFVLDGHVYLDSFYTNMSIILVLLLVCWSELFML